MPSGLPDRSAGSGSVHGRFQPFHNGHLEYVLAALAHCDFLYVGVTQYRRGRLVAVDAPDARHRAAPEHNPLTYFERATMIRAALLAAGVSGDAFTVIPFPIEEPSELAEFLPLDIPIFTTVYDAWNEEKIRVLGGLGYTVRVLYRRAVKEISGAQVRALLRDGDDAWRALVPPAAAALLDDHMLADRLARAGAARG